MSTSNNPSRVRIKDIRILSAKELSKKLDIWLDGTPFEDITPNAKMEPDKAWMIGDGAVVSDTLMIQPYLHQSSFSRGAKKKSVSIHVKADELRAVIGALTGRIEYEDERDGAMFIIGVELDGTIMDHTDPVKIMLKDVKVTGLKTKHKVHLRLVIDNNPQHSAVISGESLRMWTGQFHFDSQSHSILEVQILEPHTMHKIKLVGRIRLTIKELVELSSDIPLSLFQYIHGVKVESLSLTLTAELFSGRELAEAREAQAAIVEAQQQINVLVSPHPATSIAMSASGYVDSISSKEFVQTALGIIIDKVDVLSEIHPYAKAAWSILSAIPRAYLQYQSSLQQLQGLFEIMKESYTFVQRATILDHVASHKKSITRLVQQTTECAYFIRDHLSSHGFVSYQIRNIMSDASRMIDKYRESFENLMQSFHQDAILETEICVFHTAEMLADHISNDLLKDLAYANGARFDFDKVCLPGTRVEIIDEIIKWVNQPNDDSNASHIYVLTGAAGYGKSSIARTVAQHFEAIRRLGSSFAFTHDNKQINAQNCFSTIARDIADLVLGWKASLVKNIEHNHGQRKTGAVKEQFREFIVKTGDNLNITGPILVVIDALDECPNDSHFKDLLDVLRGQIAQLHSNIRLLITCRPEPEILKVFHGQSHVLSKDMQSISLESTRDDIHAFVKSELAEIEDSVCNDWSTQIAKKSERLFQWASTACRFINNDNIALSQSERFNEIITINSSHVDYLYKHILQNAFAMQFTTYDIVKYRYQKILDYILSLKEPLPLVALIALYDDTKEEFMAILRPLASLFNGIIWNHGPVQLCHTSFREFLTTQTRSREFYIKVSHQNENLAQRSLTIMCQMLHFNMYDIKSSYHLNYVVSGSVDISNKLPPELNYSCQYWADHLSAVKYDNILASILENWAYNYLLFWLEVESMQHQHVNHIKNSLAKSMQWLYQTSQIKLYQFIKDTVQFVTCFAMPISQSVPHIYLSALQFSSQTSLLANYYGNKFETMLDSTSKRLDNWPQIKTTIYTPGSNCCLSFASDGTQIVSGSYNGTIQLWDIQTGAQSGEPLIGHDHSVNSVAFSPDGTHIISGSTDNTIRLWNVKTGAQVGEPLTGHNDSVNSVAFSPDGTQIISGSTDNTIRLWDVQTGAEIGEPLIDYGDSVYSVAFSPDSTQIVSESHDGTMDDGDSVCSVAFSPDGIQIVSGSHDGTIRLWNVQTGAQVGEPLTGHNFIVHSVAFSPDGTHIVSGCHDGTIRLWNVQTGAQVGEPLIGHDDSVCSVTFSPDGTQIVSGSYDCTIRLWDVQTGAKIGEPLINYGDSVYSVAFSPDGTQIVSGSHDGTIRLWNVQTGAQVGEPLIGHGSVNSVAFSPDGTHIVSGSDDGTIRLWDVQIGAQIGEPLTDDDNYVTISFPSDHTPIDSGSNFHTIRLWSVQNSPQIREPSINDHEPSYVVTLSPDGTHIVTRSHDGIIGLWDVQTGAQIIEPLTGHSGSIQSVAFSPDGTQIVSGSDSGTIQLWNGRTGAQIGEPLTGHNSSIQSVAFSPDGTQIVSGSKDNTMRLWDVQTKQTIFRSSNLIFTNQSVVDLDGWVRGPQDQLVFWVPHWYRNGLYRPNNSLIIGPIYTAKIDMNRFYHGDNWEKCYNASSD